MPPKNKKEEEAARLAEEERKRKLEEQARLEDIRKYECQHFPISDMPLPVTQYIIDEMITKENQFQIIKEYIIKIQERNKSNISLRDIDIQIICEQILNDLEVSQEFNFSKECELVFINIMFVVYALNHTKFDNLIKLKETKKQQKKTLEGDKQLFHKLLTQHSTESSNCKKVFMATQLKGIIDYFNKGYLAHWNLIMQCHSHEQRPLELQVDLYIELPLQQPSLEDSTYYKPIILEDQASIKKTELTEIDEQQQHEPTDEELLESVIIQAIQTKLEEAQNDLNNRLEERQKQIEDKLREMAAPPQKKKK